MGAKQTLCAVIGPIRHTANPIECANLDSRFQRADQNPRANPPRFRTGHASTALLLRLRLSRMEAREASTAKLRRHGQTDLQRGKPRCNK
jgi:hypothetical protein